jgi:uncharacterized membrane protein
MQTEDFTTSQTILATGAIITIGNAFLLIGTTGVWYGLSTNSSPIAILAAVLWIMVIYYNHKIIRTLSEKAEDSP